MKKRTMNNQVDAPQIFSKRQLLKLFIILGFGSLITYNVYQFKFSSFIFDGIIIGGIAILGILYWIWASVTEIKQFKSTKKKQFLVAPILGIFFIPLIFGLNWYNNLAFNKPTLLLVYYDGDFNGTSIDFKTDGTYILDNHAIGFSSYFYGTYEMNDQQIHLDTNEIDGVIKSNLLEIKTVENGDVNHGSELYLFQIQSNGTVVERASEFRVVVDNRK